VALSRRRTAILGRLRHRKTREREGLFLVEGVRAATEALDRGARIRFAVTSPRLGELAGGPELRSAFERSGVEVDEVADDQLAALADTASPQGVLLACVQPEPRLDDLPARPRLLLLDGLQDPGNLGTLVRAALAFGLDGVLALEGTVDPWNPKAVRAAAGAIHAMPVLDIRWTDVAPWLERRGVPLLAAAADGRDVRWLASTPAGRQLRSAGWALAVGNEGAGVRAELTAAADAVLRVPMPGGAESLNAGVAGAILMFALGDPGTDHASESDPR
jgi:TrmH family RNA methyltransferase